MPVINFEYAPIPVHADFHRSTAPERFLLGAFGSGKSYALCAEAIAWALEQPGIRGMIARKTVPELRDSTEQVFFGLLPDALYKAGEIRRTGGHVESFTFPNGSTIIFRSLDDWQKLKSLNLGFIAIDEADEISEEAYMGLLSRIRQRDPTPSAEALGAKEITRRGVWTASNPAGHNWIWRRGVNPETRKDGAEYFKSTSFDNPYLPQDYINYLLGYPEQWIRRYVLCQFDSFAGQIYEEWNYDEHVLKDDLKLTPAANTFWMGCDPGTRNPTAALWVVVDYDGSISGHKRSMIGIAEYRESYQAAQQHAKAWRQIESKHRMKPRWRVADPVAMFSHDRGSNMKLSDQYRRLGFTFQPGPKDHKQRIPMLSQLIASRRFLLTKDCPLTFESIRDYQWEDLSSAMKRSGKDAPERPLKKNDDLVDVSQYLSSRFVSPQHAAPKRAPQTLGEEVTANIKKQLAAKQQGYAL